MQKLIEKGSLVVIVSHNLQFVQQTCTRAILLSGGHLVADGPPADIIGRYRRSA
jgi:ABC-type polysaccharide/polyol phosphate transport system ATPase subunit